MSNTACGYCILPVSMTIRDTSTDGIGLSDVAYCIVDSHGRALTRHAAEQVAPAELVELLKEVNALGPAGDNPHIGIADSARSITSAYCACRPGVVVKPRGKWELFCGLIVGGIPRLVSPDAADAPNGSPSLSRALHDFYKTEPSPLPEPPAPLTAEELAAAAEQDRKQAVCAELGKVLLPNLPAAVSTHRAQAIMDSVAAYFGIAAN